MDRFTPQNDSWPSRFNLVGYLGTLVHIWENGDNSYPFLYPPRPKAIGTGQGWKGRGGGLVQGDMFLVCAHPNNRQASLPWFAVRCGCSFFFCFVFLV